jgi:hypothetical protein
MQRKQRLLLQTLQRKLDVLSGQRRPLSHTWTYLRRLYYVVIATPIITQLRDTFEMARPWKPSIEDYDKCNRVAHTRFALSCIWFDPSTSA